jgi:hypothetical protein
MRNSRAILVFAAFGAIVAGALAAQEKKPAAPMRAEKSGTASTCCVGLSIDVHRTAAEEDMETTGCCTKPEMSPFA